MSKPRFCWLCFKQLRGEHARELHIDGHPRTLHKQCADEVKRQTSFRLINGEYKSIEWNYNTPWGYDEIDPFEG